MSHTPVSRYDLQGEYDQYMDEDSIGDYVQYSDYANLEQQHNELATKLTDVELRCVKICSQRDELQAKYDELIFAVGRKYSDKTRHETALFYIQQAERGDLTAATKAQGVQG
jgi:hypothetical protein